MDLRVTSTDSLAQAGRSAMTRASVGLAIVFAVGFAGPARGAVSSWGWRESLHRSGLAGPSAQGVHSALTVPNTTPAYLFSVPEPARTTQFLAALAHVRSLHPTRFDATHPRIGPLLGEEARLKAGLDGNSLVALHSLLPNTPYYNYYRWRRSLNSTRFDHYHPRLGPLLAEDQRVVNLINNNPNNPQEQNLIPPATTPQEPSPPPSDVSTGGGPVVPEPSSVVLFLIGGGVIVSTLLARRHHNPSA